MHYNEICKCELRRSDGRAAMCVENNFFKTKKLQMKILVGKSQIDLRKCKSNTTALNAGVLKEQGNYCALTAPPRITLYLFSQNLPSLNLQYSKFSKTYS